MPHSRTSALTGALAVAAALTTAACAVTSPALTKAHGNGQNTGAVYVYSDGSARNGALGTREATSAVCRGIAKHAYPSIAKSCKKTFALLAYESDALPSYTTPVVYGTTVAFSPDAVVYSPTLKVVANTWAAFWSGGVLKSLAGASAFPPHTHVRKFWTGIQNSGAPAALNKTCSDWSSASANSLGIVGDAAETTAFIDAATAGCADDVDNALVCLCVTGDAIKPKPSKAPTARVTKPRTRAPVT